jgi:hypothetical protein
MPDGADGRTERRSGFDPDLCFTLLTEMAVLDVKRWACGPLKSDN